MPGKCRAYTRQRNFSSRGAGSAITWGHERVAIHATRWLPKMATPSSPRHVRTRRKTQGSPHHLNETQGRLRGRGNMGLWPATKPSMYRKWQHVKKGTVMIWPVFVNVGGSGTLQVTDCERLCSLASHTQCCPPSSLAAGPPNLAANED